MNHSAEQFSPSTEESIGTEWDGLAIPIEKTEQEPNNLELKDNKSGSKDQKPEYAPEGYLTIRKISADLGLSKAPVQRAVKHLELEGEKFKDAKNGHVNTYYSPGQRVQIEEYLSDLLSASEPPEGYLTINDLSKRLNLNYGTVQKAINRLGIDGENYKDKGNKLSTYYSPEQQVQIEEYLSNLLFAPEAPEGYLVAAKIAENLSIAESTVRKIINELDLKGEKFKDAIGKMSTFYSPEQQAQMKKHLGDRLSTSDAPENYYTIFGLSKKLNLSTLTIRKAINELGLKGEKYKSAGKKSISQRIYYSPEQQIQIEEYLGDLLSVPEAPEGYLTFSGLEQNLGISKGPIEKAIRELGLEGQDFRDKSGHINIHYSPESCDQIKNHLESFISFPEAPEGYLTISGLEKLLDFSRGPIERAIYTLKIEGKEYKGKSGRIEILFSPEQQAEISEAVERNFYGSSIPENTVAFYFEQVGLNIQQDIRPNWMKNPETGRSLEIDIYIENDNPPPPGIGIEYDGSHFHQDPERDIKKNSLARQHGIEIIHIRERDCPELPDDIPCINRQGYNNHDLADCIGQCFAMLGIPLPETGINIPRDQSEIYSFMDARGIRNIDNITEEAIEDGILAVT